MGVHPEAKSFLIWLFPQCFTATGKWNGKQLPLSQILVKATRDRIQKEYNTFLIKGKDNVPENLKLLVELGSNSDSKAKQCRVALVEMMGNIKGISKEKLFKTGLDFFKKQIVEEIKDLWDRGTDIVIINFDRGAPPNKDAEHEERDKDNDETILSKYINPETGETIMGISDTTIPDDLNEYIMNRVLLKQLLYYIGQKLSAPSHIRDKYFTIPQRKYLYVFGCPTVMPQLSVEKTRIHEYNIEDTKVLYIHNPLPDKARPHHASFLDQINEIDISNILEGEMSCFYFLRFFMNEKIAIYSGDGDLLLMALISSPSRINKDTGKFNNELFVRLFRKQQGFYLNVDINALYTAIINDPIFSKFDDPVATVITGLVLMKCDYIQDFTPNIKTLRDPNSGILAIPAQLYVLMKNPKLFSSMITTHVDDKENTVQNNQFDLPVRVQVNQDLFRLMTQLSYVYKFRKAVPIKDGYTLDDIPQLERKIESLRQVLALLPVPGKQSKKAKTLMRLNRECDVFSRQVEWFLCYWLNGYKIGVPVPSPLVMVNTLPYFGYSIDTKNRCHNAVLVSNNVTYKLNSEFILQTDENSHHNSKHCNHLARKEWDQFLTTLKNTRTKIWDDISTNCNSKIEGMSKHQLALLGMIELTDDITIDDNPVQNQNGNKKRKRS